MWSLERDVTYKGELYQVVQVLDNDLLLVVLKEDLEKKTFPLPTYIVPE